MFNLFILMSVHNYFNTNNFNELVLHKKNCNKLTESMSNHAMDYT